MGRYSELDYLNHEIEQLREAIDDHRTEITSMEEANAGLRNIIALQNVNINILSEQVKRLSKEYGLLEVKYKAAEWIIREHYNNK